MDTIILLLILGIGFVIGLCVGVYITFQAIKKKGMDELNKLIDEAAEKIEEHGKGKTEV